MIIYVCLTMYVYDIYIYTYMHIYIHRYALTHTHTYTYTYYIYIYIYYIHVCVCVCLYPMIIPLDDHQIQVICKWVPGKSRISAKLDALKLVFRIYMLSGPLQWPQYSARGCQRDMCFFFLVSIYIYIYIYLRGAWYLQKLVCYEN